MLNLHTYIGHRCYSNLQHNDIVHESTIRRSYFIVTLTQGDIHAILLVVMSNLIRGWSLEYRHNGTYKIYISNFYHQKSKLYPGEKEENNLLPKIL